MISGRIILLRRSNVCRPLSRYNSSSSSSGKIPTISEIRQGMMKLTGYDHTWGQNKVDKSVLLSHVKKDQKGLIPQRMNVSYAEALIPLGDDPSLRNRYSNFQKTVRFGRLLEDLDTMAVHISYLHNKSQNLVINGHEFSPIVIVTALVDRINVCTSTQLRMDKNIKLSGFTSWVGKSSTEITMKLEQEKSSGGGQTWAPVLEAKFLLCARDANNLGSAIMNPLEIVTDEEKAIFDLGEKNKMLRHHEAQSSLINLPPNNQESQLIHEMFRKTIDSNAGTFKVRVKPPNTVWMEDTILKNVIICFPEQRNLYDKIFGGFLMRQAFELAWTNACLYSKTTPRISVVDDISFRKPVVIGSLLFLSSQVVYTEDNYIQVKVHAQTVDPKTAHKEVTNDFHFKFLAVGPTFDYKICQVIPKTYAESMMYIDGKRHM